MDKVYVIMTELNGYKNIEPHPLAYCNEDDAERARDAYIRDGRYDQVYILVLPVAGIR